MTVFIRKLFSIFSPPEPVPQEYRANFVHLYFDVFWFGLLNGSTLSFLIVYATRLGASGTQIGLINAMPAVVTLLFAFPASLWISRRSIRGAVFWSALSFRLFYLLLVPLPVLFSGPVQIWLIIAATLIMNVPGTGLAVGFNALFAEAVPVEWRGYVAGIRNAVYAFAATLTTLACGYILTHSQFETGYQIVFALGFVGGIASTIHVGLVKPLSAAEGIPVPARQEPSQKTRFPVLRFLLESYRGIRLDILNTRYRVPLLLLFCFHLAQYLALPVFPLFTVNELKFSDQIISLGSSLFSVATFLASFWLAGLVRRLGNKKMMGIGIVMLSIYPGIMSVTHGVGLYALASLIGGAAWAVAGGVLYNYLLDYVPANDRPAHLAWYTLALNAAILIGSMAGPALAAQFGLTTAMVIFALARFFAGVAILRWG